MSHSIPLPLFFNLVSENAAWPIKPGVYVIRNKTNGHFYIGSTTNLRQRKDQHLWGLRANRHHNPHLQNAWNKYGEENFEFLVTEVVIAADDIVAVEQRWIDGFDAVARKDCYNLLPIAGTTAGRVVSEETRHKMSLAQTGKKHSTEAKEKMRLAKLGRRQSPEHVAKVAAKSRGRKLPPRPASFAQKFRKLTNSQVAELRQLHNQGVSNKQIAARYCVSESTIGRILKGESYRGVGIE
jgi:group I intron endonuclease